MSPMHPDQLSAEIRQQARLLGFDLVGIAPAEQSGYRDYFRQWLDTQQHGTMQYLERRFDERTDPRVYVPEARSVICVAANYHVPLKELPQSEKAHHGKVSRYALGEDYHEIIKSRLFVLADWIRQRAPEAITRCAVDTAPVMEKELSARAGVGWLGKNTCIINESIGSWLLLGEIITSLELHPDNPAIDRCGTCTRCIDACPTQAITAPYQLDARRCISYLTIEHRGEIPQEFHAPIGDWVFGCDICQDVCPWNRKAPEAIDPAMQPRLKTGTLDLREVLSWRVGEPNGTLRNSAMKRVKLPQLQRNARIVMENHR
jgi:epoxyqueuosine reductase